MKVPRRIQKSIATDLKKKMVFVAGPRQCGKTFLAKTLIAESKGAYYNWDIPRDRHLILKRELDASKKLWAFDELHKYRQWRNYLKGVFDEFKDDHSILVTGSARLDVYHRSGDSLQGRYFLYRTHPLTLGEIERQTGPATSDEVLEINSQVDQKASQSALKELLELGGFPEPFLSGSKVEAQRWRESYGHLCVREELRELEPIRELDKVALLFDHLSRTVGSVLSINSFREDLEVAFETVRHWISVLENLYMVFRIPPFGASRIKAVKKEQKLYFWDWSRAETEASRFENLIAVHLMRMVHWFQDTQGERLELRYFRDVTGREIDFIILRKEKPWIAIEAKLDDRPLEKSFSYLLERVPVEHAFQVSLHGLKDFVTTVNRTKVRSLPASRFLLSLP